MFEPDFAGQEATAAATDAASVHLASMPVDVRRSNGQVYTPPPIVDFILEESKAGLDDLPLPIIDPACGCGVFLTNIIERFARRMTRDGVNPATRVGRARLLSLAREGVFGMDVDPEAVHIARRAMADALSAATTSEVSAAAFRSNVVVSDFLLEELDRPAPEAFDLVVGNPPYVTTSRLRSELKDVLRTRYTTASGRLDLYMLFMERSIELLRPGGRFSLITPDKFFSSESARKLRELLIMTGSVLRISTFSSHDVFERAATVPSVTVWERGRAQGGVLVQECALDDLKGSVIIGSRGAISSDRLGSNQWNLRHGRVDDLASRLASGHPTLRSYATRISAGTATGLNDAFLIRGGTLTDVEPELLRPIVRGRDIDTHSISTSDICMLVPYRFRDGQPELIDLEHYPRARAWLEPWRPRLERRHCVRTWGKQWYDLHDPVPFDLGQRDKIVVPDIARHNRFAFDAGRLWPMHSVYYVIVEGISPAVLTAILNSPAVEFLVRVRAPRVKDGFSRYRRQFLLDLPVPEIDRSLSQQIERAVRNGDLELARVLTMEPFGMPLATIEDALRNLDDTAPREGRQRAPRA